jgi:hypothetical protein
MGSGASGLTPGVIARGIILNPPLYSAAAYSSALENVAKLYLLQVAVGCDKILELTCFDMIPPLPALDRTAGYPTLRRARLALWQPTSPVPGAARRRRPHPDGDEYKWGSQRQRQRFW